jgi:hypothetical protein
MAAMNAVTRLVVQSTTVSRSCPIAFLPRPRKNCGPTLYPVANRKKSKNTTLTSGEMVTPI